MFIRSRIFLFYRVSDIGLRNFSEKFYSLLQYEEMEKWVYEYLNDVISLETLLRLFMSDNMDHFDDFL